METITKKEVAEKLHQKVGLSKRLLYNLIDILLEEIKLALEREEEVQIVRFGSFVTYKTKGRIGRNLKTGEEVIIPPFKKVIFKIASQFKAELHNETS
ncbi:HU family DNA-binding protein [Thermodesulfobacterium hydrogeniphilum]|uniref:HU family DNA-binding protein n=1 Tax=Thermodesulfobacterium hydrogeniphilum TaxID=161156 RepID=UPI000571E8CA|nr:HU family DNA-binding protein [Thermodesulfobacterium hydrogeniphilum]